MVVSMQIVTSLRSTLLELPVSGYKNVGMHTLVPTTSAEPLNAMFLLRAMRGTKPDMAWRRVLNSYTGGLSHGAV
jgi:hypothetical protein